MAASVPPKAVGKVLADRVVADADTFERFAQHYMGIIVSKKKWQNCLPQTGVRRSERLIAKRKNMNENVCTKKIKTKKTLSNQKAKRRVPFHKLCITPRENIVKISDDDDLQIIDPVPEPASTEPQIDSNNNQEMATMSINLDSSSEDETEQNERKILRLLENESGMQVSHNGGTSNQTEDNPLQNQYEETIEQDASSSSSSSSSSSIRSTSTSMGYYSFSQIMTSHAAYTPNREPYTPIGGMHNRYQEMPMTGAALHSNLYSCNESQERMTPSTPYPISTPEQAAHSFSEELPSNSAHCVFQLNQLTELTTINDRPSRAGSSRAAGAGDASDRRRGGEHISDEYIDIRKMASSDNNSLTRTGIFSIFFGNNQHAYISGHMFFNSEEDNFQFEQHFFNQPRMSNNVPYQHYNRNYNSQHHHVYQTQFYQPSRHEYEQSVPVNYEDQGVTNTDSNYAQRGRCNMECSSPSVQSVNSKYETIEIVDSDDECADDTFSETTFPAPRAASDNPRLNLMSFMTMVSNGELSVAEWGRINTLRPAPQIGNIRLRIDLQENAIVNSQTGSGSMEWDNLGYSHGFPTVRYNVLYGPAPGEQGITFNELLFTNENQQRFYRYIPWLLGIWHQRYFISWVVDCEEIP